MPKFSRGRKISKWRTNRPVADSGKLRIIGGRFGGRQIQYSGDPITRPMKDNIREALFNLIGGWVQGKAVFDLFAGTGAMGLEAVSRGASQATLVERHFPSVKLIQDNIDCLEPGLPVRVEASDSFFWVRQFQKHKQDWPAEPWTVFFCPPYALFEERVDDLLEMIGFFHQTAPMGSLLVVESDSRFDPNRLPAPESWSVREYSPALISVHRPQQGAE